MYFNVYFIVSSSEKVRKINKKKTPNGQLYINTGVFVFHLEIRIKFVNWAARQAFYLHYKAQTHVSLLKLQLFS